MKIIDMLNAGGFVMYPLFIFSILAWAVALHKIYVLCMFSRASKRINSGVLQAISEKKLENISAALQGQDENLVAPHNVLLDNMGASKEDVKERLGRKLTQTNGELKKHLWILGSISATSPFIGLFGTVVGIMGSFKAIGTSGKSGFSVVASGISESLVATASGIIVAVVALLFYNFLQTRVNSQAQDFRLKLEDVADLLRAYKNSGK